ncbi:hypothetical protein EUGRSUZ_K00392 [Eucalyptus grandis]|uniref:Uncharacterized protein n=2 Tax=Eucalyptus grandis TaxID=71139 RepID=A0ACC3IQ41_EUCGR|nr:hypothetical protein EUGRSUZ_K00392 [Eucalyptus grandis]
MKSNNVGGSEYSGNYLVVMVRSYVFNTSYKFSSPIKTPSHSSDFLHHFNLDIREEVRYLYNNFINFIQENS